MRKILAIIILLSLIICSEGYAQKSLGWRYLDYGALAHDSHDLEGSMKLLNLWKEQPVYIQEIFKHAFNIFSNDSEATYASLSGNQEFINLAEKYGISYLGGPMLGNISETGATIWIRTLREAAVEIVVEIDGEIKKFGPVFSSGKSDMSAVVNVDGLLPGGEYPYKILLNNKAIESKNEMIINTLPANNSKENVRVTFGTCFHRWGLSNEILLKRIKSRKSSAFLIGGDVAVQDRKGNSALHRSDFLLRDFQPAWRNLVATLPVYTTWDDHDYFHDDSYNIHKGFKIKDKENIWKVFRYAWNNPSYGFGEDEKGVFFKTRIGPADVIMLDNRYFREKGSFLGEKQMGWLKQELLKCEGPFIILSCGTMWSDHISNGKDSWGAFDPEGREDLFNFIEENKIAGVLLISGNSHGARGFTIPRPSGFNFYEFGVASLGGWLGDVSINTKWKTQLYGMTRDYAFGEFEFNSNLTDPEVTFRLIHEKGDIMYELTLTRGQLTP